MKSLTEYFWFNTPGHRAYLNITDDVAKVVSKSGVQEGMVLVSAMHITAGVFVNDDEPGILEDIDFNELRENKEKISLNKDIKKPTPKMPFINGALWAIQSKIVGLTNLRDR